MNSVLGVSSVTDTTLWKHLNDSFVHSSDAAIARTLAENVAALCKEAEDRIKAMPALHPEFTLHDDRHFVRVAELMAMLLGGTVGTLNPIEVALLILAAYFHDQGMVPDSSDLESIDASDD
jgi:HD-GYP domain-containing protein (c-di-GMP phosphodiesterase class II)